MRYYQKENVFDAALNRIRYLFDEFENIIINFSGGKDSTVILNLSLQVAEEKNRLPLTVQFTDQEAEWDTVISYIRTVMNDSRVNPLWLQVPIRLFNATSTTEPWLFCWDPEKEGEWIREKEPNSIHENVYGTDRFANLFEAVSEYMFPDAPAIHIAGVRAEESPGRLLSLTTAATYKGITWGRVGNKRKHHYTFYPIYDWSYTDVWKAIHDNGWPYCKLYDYMYQYGVPVRKMRVSNVHHETAVRSLFYLQEIESDTWERITKRLRGINTAGILQDQFFIPNKLPVMFSSWAEYRDYLLENLISDEDNKKKLRQQFLNSENRYIPDVRDKLCRVQIQAILVNDYHGTKLQAFHSSHTKDTIKYREERGLPLSGPLPQNYIHYD